MQIWLIKFNKDWNVNISRCDMKDMENNIK